jgi:hypothetical protein
MIEHIRPEFTPDILPTFNGYHLQIFAAGRAKISLQTVTMKKKHEFFAACPKKDRAAFKRQKARSLPITRWYTAHDLQAGQCAEQNRRKLRGFDYLAKVITGVTFKDGIEAINPSQIAA